MKKQNKNEKRKMELLDHREQYLRLIEQCNELISKGLYLLDQTENENLKNELKDMIDKLVYYKLKELLHLLREVEDELDTLK